MMPASTSGGLLAGRIPRVTEVIDLAGLGSDFSAVPAAKLAAAQERGTLVHRAVEIFDDGDLDRDSVPEKLRGYVDAYEAWTIAVDYRPIATEFEVRHPLGFVGHLDKVGWITGRRWLPDIKTPLALNPGPLLLQLAAYYHGWNATCPTEPLAGVASLQLRPNRTYLWRPRTEIDVAWSVFCSALAMLQGRATAGQLAAIDAWAARYGKES